MLCLAMPDAPCHLWKPLEYASSKPPELRWSGIPNQADGNSAPGPSRHSAPPHDVGRKRGEADMSRICVRALFLSGRSRLLVFRGEGAKYFKLFCKFVLGRRRRRLHHLGAECLRQQRSDKLEIIVRLFLAQLPDPARAMTREIGLECTHERFPE